MMNDYRLPGGDPAWFVRTRSGLNYQITPCTRQGWLLLIGYCVFEVGASIAIFTGASPPSIWRWVGWAILFIVPSAAFIWMTIRKSVPARQPREIRGRR